jgi:hypothetical protein
MDFEAVDKELNHINRRFYKLDQGDLARSQKTAKSNITNDSDE